MQDPETLNEFVAGSAMCLLYLMGLGSALLILCGVLRLWKWLVSR